MKTRLFFFLFSIVFISWAQKPAYQQMMYDKRYNFYEVVKAAEQYFQIHDKKAKGSGYKQFMRWVYDNQYKYYPSGDRRHEDPLMLQKAWKDYLLKTPQLKDLQTNNDWEEIGPRYIDSITNHYSVGLGRVIDILPVTQDTLFLSSEAGGLWKTTDGGQTWSPKSDGLIAAGADALECSPFNHSKMYMDVQNSGNYYSYGIYRSDDAGETWYESGFNPANLGFGGLGDDFRIYTIKCHPTVPDLIFIGTNKGLFVSTDDLQTWTHITQIFDHNSSCDIQVVTFHPADANTVYVMDNYYWADRSKIFISNDMGQTWHTSGVIVDNNAVPNDKRAVLDVSDAYPDRVYFASDNGVWQSDDKGENFTFIANPAMGVIEGFSVNNDNAGNMIYGYLDVMNTHDGGNTWQQVTHWSLGNTNGAWGSSFSEQFQTATDYVHADLHPAKYLNGTFYIGTDGFMCKSEDGGDNWEIISQGTGIRENYRLGVSQSDMDVLITGSQDNGGSYHAAYGWVEITGGDGMEGIVLPVNSSVFIGSYQFGSRYRSFNEGQSLASVTPPSGNDAFWTAPLAYDPNDHFTIYDFRNGIWKSTNFGTNWTQISTDVFGSDYWDNIFLAEIARNNSRIMLVANNSSLKKSIDGGVSFTQINGLPDLFITDVAIAPYNDDIFFTTYGNFDHPADKIYMSTNGGGTWQNITYNLNNIPVHSIVVDNTPQHNIYAGTELGVFYKAFNANAWLPLGNNLPKAKVNEMEIQEASNYLYITTWGRGVWRTKLVGRESFPEIRQVLLDDPPTLTLPKQGMEEYLTAIIDYQGNLTDVHIKYSVNNTALNQSIQMIHQGTNIWRSENPLPTANVDDKVYFKIEATGDNNDTTESFMYMYKVYPFEYCDASGNNSGNLYLTNVKINDDAGYVALDNTSTDTGYIYYDNPVVLLEAGATYQFSTTANNDWGGNDHMIWIDFNRNAEFEETERVIYDIDVNQTAATQYTIPQDAVKNATLRMRARLGFYASSNQPCGQSIGEVEDYAVMIVDDISGYASESMPNNLKVYPNPSTGVLYIEFSEYQQASISIFDITGKMILQQKISGKKNLIDISRLTKSYYLLQIRQDSRLFYVNLLKK